MDFLIDIPALFKVGLIFILILAANLRWHMSIGLFAGSILLGVWMGQPFDRLLVILLEGVLAPRTISLILIVMFILVMSRLMSDSGQLERIVTGFTKIVPNVKIVSMFMPALIGLLPMPGGALFSAPMVDSACRKADAAPEIKTVVNYWFRHIWEPWWPVYPGVILALSMTGIETWHFMAVQMPMTLLALASGAFFLMPGVNGATAEIPVNNGSRAEDWKEFRREVRPITAIVLSVPTVKIFEYASGINLPGLSSVIIGLTLCLGIVIRRNRIPASKVFKAVINKSVLPMLILVVAIMTFQNMLIGTGAIDEIQAEMLKYGIPPLLIIMLIPLLSGLITGIGIGFVGASFPLVIPLLSGMNSVDYLFHAGLAFNLGYIGMMLSPVHLCLLVTKDYFSANLLKSYRFLVGPAVTAFLTTMAVFALSRFIV